jgi:hypothetical protein
VLVAQHRFNGDMFNSAPLIVAGSSGGGAVNVILTTARGFV